MRVLLLAVLAARLSFAAAPPVPDPAWDGLSPSIAESLTACEAAYLALDFDKAEALAQAAIQAEPLHPLPRIFFQGALLARLQTLEDAGKDDHALVRRFEEASAEALRAAGQRALDAPGAWAEFYLGGALGARGLVRLYHRHYLDSYHDGKAAAGHLREALRLDPGLEAAWLGRGQYEYYCGTFSGLLRWVLRLHGDIGTGIAYLKRCGAGSSYAALVARVTLARILSSEQVRPQEALPYVREARDRFPWNDYYVIDALNCARAMGPQDPDARALVEAVRHQWADGWRPRSWSGRRIRGLLLSLGVPEAALLEGSTHPFRPDDPAP